MIKLSIITINYNNASGLSKTMESVISQNFSDFEYIVIDGGSTDGSVDIIKKYAEKLTFWVSEPDKGIYNAMNKGISMASGEYLLFLNSGDWFVNNEVIAGVIPYLNSVYEIVSGGLILVKNEEEHIQLNPPNTVNLNYCIHSGLTHPNTFIRAELFEKYGYYNEHNKIVSDWEFFLIVCGLNKCKYQGIPVLVSCFTMDGISSRNDELLKKETEETLQRLLPWWKKLERFIRR